MENYFFVYRDSIGTWKSATNPKFIASHTKCRAIEKKLVLDKFSNLRDLLNELNGWEISKEAYEFVDNTELLEIVV